MKWAALAISVLLSTQVFAFTIECLSENNLDISQYGFESLKIERTPKGNFITINDRLFKLGDALPVKLGALRMTHQSESFTVLSPLIMGDVTISVGSSLSYLHNRMELQKYKDTEVTLVDFGQRIQLTFECQLTK